MKDFVVINFGECFKSMRKKLYSKLDEERNLRKVPKSFYTFRTTLDDITKDELIEKPAEAKFKIQTMLQRALCRTKTYVQEDWIVKTIVEHALKISACYYRRK